jgi:hypothetical protein
VRSDHQRRVARNALFADRLHQRRALDALRRFDTVTESSRLEHDAL